MLSIILSASVLLMQNPAISGIGVAISVVSIITLMFSGIVHRLIVRRRLVKIIKSQHPIIGKVISRNQVNNNIVILGVEFGKNSSDIALVNIDNRETILGAPDEYFSLSVGKSAQFYKNIEKNQGLIAPVKKIEYASASVLREWFLKRWWLIVVLPIIAYFVFLLISGFAPNYRFECLQYVSGEIETVWEMHEYSKNSDEKVRGAYKIMVSDAKTGKKIKKIKKEYSTEVKDFTIVQQQNKVWVIGRAFDYRPVIDLYDAKSYELLDEIESLEARYPKLQTGVISGELMYSGGKIHDNMYIVFFTLPRNRILKLKTADANTCYLDIETERFYENDMELYWDLCLAGYSMIESYSKYIYYLIYESDSTSAKLYQGTPPETLFSYFYNTYPQALDNRYQQQFMEYIGLKEFVIDQDFNNAKIVYQDIDVLCVFHNTPNKNPVYRITCFNHVGEILAEIDLSKFKNYSCYAHQEIKPYSIRKDKKVKFRIKYLGWVSYNVETHDVNFFDEGECKPLEEIQIFLMAHKDNRIYNLFRIPYLGDNAILQYNDMKNYNADFLAKNIEGTVKLATDQYFRNASIIYQNGKFALIFYCHVPGDDSNYRIAAIDFTGKELFAIEKEDFPNGKKFSEDYQQYGKDRDYSRNITVQENNNAVILIFEKFGVLAVNIKNGGILWKYEVKDKI